MGYQFIIDLSVTVDEEERRLNLRSNLSTKLKHYQRSFTVLYKHNGSRRSETNNDEKEEGGEEEEEEEFY